MKTRDPLPRREFLQQAATAAAMTGAVASSAYGQDANAKPAFNVALIGCGGMGSNHLQVLSERKDLRVGYVCDVDSNHLAKAAKTVTSAGQPEPKAVKDLREVLDDKSVDAVWIATPDHWHSPGAILACQAGKHVYVEKPVCHNIREGRLLTEAARKTNRVVQVGTQSRSSPTLIAAIQKLHDGIIGDVLVAKAWNSQLRGNIGHQSPSEPPAHLDYDLWLGPAPERPYQSNLLHSVWRFFYDFGVGDIGNDGVHEIDIARWGLGVAGHPSKITGMGSKYFFDDDQQFPDNQYCIYEWPADAVLKKRMLVFEQRDWSPYVQEGHENGVAFYGTKGMMIVGKANGYRIFGPRNKLIEEGPLGVSLPPHHQNFLDCIQSAARPRADAEEGHFSAALCHLGNIACRTGRALQFDPKAEKIIGDDDAQAYVRRQYRSGHWAVPQGA